MKKKVRKYNLHDPSQIKDEKEYWQDKSPKERLAAAEKLRNQFMELKGIDAEQRLQRVLRIVESEQS